MQREEFLSHCILGDCRCCYYLERLTHIVSTVGEKCVYVRKECLCLCGGVGTLKVRYLSKTSLGYPWLPEVMTLKGDTVEQCLF